MEQHEHIAELKRLLLFLGATALILAISYVVPAAEELRPWLPGEDLPLAHLLESGAEVREGEQGELRVVETAVIPQAQAATAAPGDLRAERMPKRAPGIATLLELEEGVLDPFFEALAAVEDGEPGRIVRILHWGDSTIAGDGITGTVRARMQARFGDGGPGFLSVHFDPRWSYRPGIARWPKGDWETLSITFAGAPTARYGLAGTVSTAPLDCESCTSSVGGRKIDDAWQKLHRFDLFFQAQPEGGTLSAVPKGHRGRVFKTAAKNTYDRFKEFTVEDGATWMWFKAHGDGPVTVYGIAGET